MSTVMFPRGSEVSNKLAQVYDGLRFSNVDVWMTPQDCREHVTFSVSGSKADLLRHGFIAPGWTEQLPPCGIAYRRLEGFGRARLHRRKTGYSVSGASYDDGLEKLMAVLPPVWTPPTPDEHVMTRAQAIAAVRALLRAGLTVRDVAEYLRAHPRAVAALLA